MSMYVKIASVCGSVVGDIDVFDLDLNPHGSVCCDNCRLIIETRESWAKEYDFTF